MNCIQSIKRNPVPNDVFLKTTKLYYQMGKNDYYQSLFKESYHHISSQVANQDSYSFFKIFFPENFTKIFSDSFFCRTKSTVTNPFSMISLLK